MFKIGDLVKRGIDFGFITKVSNDRYWVKWFYIPDVEMGPYSSLENKIHKMVNT